jgi:hypothetical protein
MSTGYSLEEAEKEGKEMKKFTLLIGMGAGFVAGSWAGRAPYEHLEGLVRNVMKQPKVQATLHTAADSAATARDATLDAASRSAIDAIDEAATKVTTGTQKVASKVGNGS